MIALIISTVVGILFARLLFVIYESIWGVSGLSDTVMYFILLIAASIQYITYYLIKTFT